jgi:hypothetical protein
MTVIDVETEGSNNIPLAAYNKSGLWSVQNYLTWIWNDFCKKVGATPKRFEVGLWLFQSYENSLTALQKFTPSGVDEPITQGLVFKSTQVKPKSHLLGWEVRVYV